MQEQAQRQNIKSQLVSEQLKTNNNIVIDNKQQQQKQQKQQKQQNNNNKKQSHHHHKYHKNDSKKKQNQISFDKIKMIMDKIRKLIMNKNGKNDINKYNQKQQQQNIKKLIEQNIKSLSYKQSKQLKAYLDNILIKTNKQYKNIIQQYLYTNNLLKQLSLVTPIIDVFYQSYIQYFNILLNYQQNNINKQQLLLQWNKIPFRHLQSYLQTFHLIQQYQNKINIQNFIQQLIHYLVDNKVQQVCQYYKLYINNNQNYIQKQNIQHLNKIIKQFQQQHLIPKLIKSDYVLSNHAISFLKINHIKHLKQVLFNQLDPSLAVRLIQALNQYNNTNHNVNNKKISSQQQTYQNTNIIINTQYQDIKNYPKVYNYILKQHYRSIVHQYKDSWYIIQDKISFSKQFIHLFVQQLKQLRQLKTNNKNQNNHIFSNIDFKQYQNNLSLNIKHLQQSLLYRANLLSLQKVQKLIQNPFYKYDHYGNSQQIIYKTHLYNQSNKHQKYIYISLNQYGLFQQNIFIVDNIQSKQFHLLKEQMLNIQKIYDKNIHKQTQQEQSNILVGFDTQFKNIQTKFDTQGCSIMQICTKKRAFIIDFLKLQNNQTLKDFMIYFLTNPKIIKVGHTVDSDLKQLAITFKFPKNKACSGFIDVCKLFKAKHVGTKYSSLSYMCEVLLGKKLSKYEQRSNWIRRPLKKTQIHYAISDSFACLLCLQKLQSNEQLKFFQQKQLVKGKMEVQQIIRQPNLVYSSKYQYLIRKQKTKFLVDNMLKKLCSIMRNIGIDTQYISVKNQKLALQLAQNEERVIITKDTKFFSRKQQSVPIYLLEAKQDSESMFDEIVKKFKLNLKKFSSLSRCVKCNGDELQDLSRDQALKTLNFKHEQSQIMQFWRCMKCKQIYWEGNQFKRAKNQYDKMKKK